MFTDLNQALDVLMARRRTFHPQLFKFRACMEALGNPQHDLPSIHIAGTNGKGSTTNFIRSIAQAQGYKVGSFTSPHLVRHHDRFRINDRDISDEKLLELINRSYPLWDEYDITMFEIDMLIATWFFIDEQVDIAIFEVGMGGRKDATNILKPLASVITNISLDHMDQLGDTVEKIGVEKAGIIQPMGLVFTGEQKESVKEIFREKANRPIFEVPLIEPIESRTFEYRDQIVKIKSYAKYQLQNAALAFEVCYQLNEHNMMTFEMENIIKGLSETEWKGRFEIVNTNPLTIIDGAHNEAGIARLIESMTGLKKPINVVFAALRDKDVRSMVKQLNQSCDQLIVTEFDFYRAERAVNLKFESDILVIEDFNEAIKEAERLTGDGTLIITGSLYFISEVRDGYNLD